MAATADTLTWTPTSRIALHRARPVGFDLALLELRRVRDTFPTELLRLDRSCKVFEFGYVGTDVAIAVLPDDLPALRAALRVG